ncbi:hypothetical protein Dimus_038756 [Dionaea muscipula]
MDLDWRDDRALRATGDADRLRLVLDGASTALALMVVVRCDSASGWLVLGLSGWQGEAMKARDSMQWLTISNSSAHGSSDWDLWRMMRVSSQIYKTTWLR